MATVAINNTSSFTVADLYDQYRLSHLTQLAAMVAAIAIPIILSSAGLLPSIIWKVSVAVIVIAIPVKLLIAKILLKFNLMKGDPAKYEQYEQGIIKSGPTLVTIIGPIIEEALFRGALQGSLSWSLRQILPVAAIAIGGTSILISSAIAMVVASSIFGYAHAKQHPIQAVVNGLSSLMIEAPLFHFYGLHMACFAHIVNNTTVSLLMTASMEFQRKERKPILLT